MVDLFGGCSARPHTATATAAARDDDDDVYINIIIYNIIKYPNGDPISLFRHHHGNHTHFILFVYNFIRALIGTLLHSGVNKFYASSPHIIY